MDEPIKQAKKYPLFFKNNTFTPQEVACLVSNYHPNEVGNNWNKVAWLSANPEFEEALDFSFSAVRGRLFEEVDVDLFVISSDELKIFLNSKDIVISGFNDSASVNPTNENLVENTQLKNTIASLKLDMAIAQLAVEELNAEVERLKTELLAKEQKIEELELIQTTDDKSKLGSTRAENNVSKLILTLSAQAKIDTSKPYAQYESLKAQAELLGIDKFPSDENVASWLKKANSQNPN